MNPRQRTRRLALSALAGLALHAGLWLAGMDLASARAQGWLLAPFSQTTPVWPWSPALLGAVQDSGSIAQAGRELGLSYILITHDLDVVQYLCDRVVVLYLGRVMEIAPTTDLFASPAHPYTRALLSAAPIPYPAQAAPRVELQGDPPSPLNPPSGCVFRSRCPHAVSACADTVPQLTPTTAGRLVACWRHEELN